MAVIGIDLGTTNSLGAVYRNGEVELIPNRFGSYLTPSAVSFLEDGTVLVGQEAKERAVSAPGMTAMSFKRDMGTERIYELGKKKFKPEELSAFVLRSIVADAEAYTGEKITEAVISVPAYFHDRQRTATKTAGELAGLKVKRIINEPSAAALAAYVETEKEMTYMVFDFGGGTLDISIVSCFDTMVQIETVAGDNRLGGNDFDTAIARSFLEEHGFEKKDLSREEYAVLLRKAEACKKQLTEKDRVSLTVPVNGKSYQSKFSNARLLGECGDIFAKIKELIGRALRDRKYTTADIDQVILAGGSSKMPLVRSYIHHLFGKKPMSTEYADELIAEGLGVICGIILREGDIRDYIMTDISSFSLGTAIRNEADPGHDYMSVLIPRNTPLPCSKSGVYTTSVDGQKQLRVDVYQGEQIYVSENLKLGELMVDVKPAPAGEEKINVRFTYDIDGILVVDVTVMSTGQKISKVFSKETDEEKIKEKIVYLEQFKVEPKDKAENRLLMEKLKALFESCGPEAKTLIQSGISKFETLLKENDEKALRRYRKFLQKVLDEMEDYDPFVSGAPVLIYDEDDYDDDDEYLELWEDGGVSDTEE